MPEQSLKLQDLGSIKEVKAVISSGHDITPPRYTEASLLTAMENPGKFIEDKNYGNPSVGVV